MGCNELIGLMLSAVRSGTEEAFNEHDVLPQWLTKSQAYRLCGRSNVDRWINEGLIGFEGETKRKRIDRKRLEAIMAASNRITYLPVAGR